MHFEVEMNREELARASLAWKDDVARPLHAALRERGFGGVVDGGAGMFGSTITVVMDDDFEPLDAVDELRALLRSLNVPPSTRIRGEIGRLYSWLVWDD